MNYKGKLYGKIAGKYFDTGATSEDYDRLTDWKESMMKVHSELDLQGIGTALELPLGSSIAPQVLPRIKELIEQNAELVANIQLLLQSLDYDALGVMSELIIEDLKELLTKYNHLKSNTNETDLNRGNPNV